MRTKQSSRKRKPKCPVHSGTQGTNVAQTFAFFIRYICSSTSFCISRSQGHVLEKGKVVSKVVGMAAVDHSPPGSKNSIISTRKHLLHRQKVLSNRFHTPMCSYLLQLPPAGKRVFHPPPPSQTRVKTTSVYMACAHKNRTNPKKRFCWAIWQGFLCVHASSCP